MVRWLFSRRRREAIAAWVRYREAVGSHLPEEPPTLFVAGFTMGVRVAQDAAKQTEDVA